MIKAKPVKTITVMDPDDGFEVDVIIYKLSNGAMVGIDASYVEQAIGTIYSPYDAALTITIDEGDPEDDAEIVINGVVMGPNGLRCSVCGEPQENTPSGAICENGHGGAPPMQEGEPNALGK